MKNSNVGFTLSELLKCDRKDSKQVKAVLSLDIAAEYSTVTGGSCTKGEMLITGTPLTIMTKRYAMLINSTVDVAVFGDCLWPLTLIALEMEMMGSFVRE